MNHTLIVFLLCLSYSFFKFLPLKGVYWCVFFDKSSHGLAGKPNMHITYEFLQKNNNKKSLSYSAECFSVTSVHVFFKDSTSTSESSSKELSLAAVNLV